MTLPTSGSLSTSQFNTELGRSSTAQLSLSETRTLAGVPFGALSFSNLYGKSSLTFSIAPGTYYETIYRNILDFDITSSTNVLWQYSPVGAGQTEVYDGINQIQNSSPFTSTGIKVQTYPNYTGPSPQVGEEAPNYVYWTITATFGGSIVGTWYITHEVTA